MIFQILDANYTYDSERNPLVQLFGTTPQGRSVTCRVAGFRPYFYAGVEESLSRSAIEDLQALGLDVEEVERFEPIGFQATPKKMLKITTHDPKEVRSLRERAKEVAGIKAVYETDILFKNRFLIDRVFGRHGMGGGAPSGMDSAVQQAASAGRLCPATGKRRVPASGAA